MKQTAGHRIMIQLGKSPCTLKGDQHLGFKIVKNKRRGDKDENSGRKC